LKRASQRKRAQHSVVESYGSRGGTPSGNGLFLVFQEFRSSGVAGVTDDTFSTILYMEQIKLTSVTPATPELLRSAKVIRPWPLCLQRTPKLLNLESLFFPLIVRLFRLIFVSLLTQTGKKTVKTPWK